MATTSKPDVLPPTKSHPAPNRAGLELTSYEQTSGLLLACLVLFAFVAVVLGAAWYSTQLWVPKTVAVKIVAAQKPPPPKDVGDGGSGDGLGSQPVAEEFVEPVAIEAQAAEPPTDLLEAISLAAPQSEALD